MNNLMFEYVYYIFILTIVGFWFSRQIVFLSYSSSKEENRQSFKSDFIYWVNITKHDGYVSDFNRAEY